MGKEDLPAPIISHWIGLERYGCRLPGEGNLEGAVSCDERGQTRQRLFSGAADTNKQRVAAWSANDSRDPHQVTDRVVEEHQIHPSTAHTVVVLTEK